MKKLHIKRWQKIVDHLEEVHPKKFDLRYWISSRDNFDFPNPIKMSKEPTKEGDCGTSACVVGWFPHLFPRYFKWDSHNFVVPRRQPLHPSVFTWTVANFLGVYLADLELIIFSRHYNSDNPKAATVVKKIRKILKEEYQVELD